MKFNKDALEYSTGHALLTFVSLMVYGFVRDLTNWPYNYLLVGLTISWLAIGYYLFNDQAKCINEKNGESDES